MKKVIILAIFVATALVSCKKDDTATISVDKSINPVLISISVDSTTTEIMRVR